MNPSIFEEKFQLIGKFKRSSSTSQGGQPEPWIPNEPSILNTDTQLIAEFLTKELSCPIIKDLYPHMYWVARKSGSHIDPLHDNLVKERSIKVTENPELHLAWYKKTIWIKPVPHCLFSHDFWMKHLAEPTQTQSVNNGASSRRHDAIGFIRSYAHLIRHESDFLLAQECNLLPKEGLSYIDFQQFVNPFRHILDQSVSPRYNYGQLRVTRLNWAVRMFQPEACKGKGWLNRLYYHQLHWNTEQFVEEYLATFVFIFATLSVILSAMQVILAARIGALGGSWVAFVDVSWGFSIAVIVLSIVMFLLLGGLVGWVFASQLGWSWWQQRKEKKRLKKEKKEKKKIQL
ncbi:hypothetical protein BGZ57DRAFT_826198 [Hyaloscypha finlandica]|nr:hypothetical protein BGZ57DRAFT_826198 [Hyaloscypha finlandica]